MPMTSWGSLPSRINRPTIERSAPNLDCRIPSLSITTRAAPGTSSASRKSRPSWGDNPRVAKYRQVTCSPPTASGCWPSIDIAAFQPVIAAAEAKISRCCCQSRTLPGDAHSSAGPPRAVTSCQTMTSCRASAYGSGRRRTPFTRLKIEVVAPIPTARARITVIVKPGVRARVRKTKRRSAMKSQPEQGACRPRRLANTRTCGRWPPIRRRRLSASGRVRSRFGQGGTLSRPEIQAPGSWPEDTDSAMGAARAGLALASLPFGILTRARIGTISSKTRSAGRKSCPPAACR